MTLCSLTAELFRWDRISTEPIPHPPKLFYFTTTFTSSYLLCSFGHSSINLCLAACPVCSLGSSGERLRLLQSPPNSPSRPRRIHTDASAHGLPTSRNCPRSTNSVSSVGTEGGAHSTQNLNKLSFSDGVFSPPSFRLNQNSTPWLLFNDAGQTAVLSPASDFIASQMHGNGKELFASGLNLNLEVLNEAIFNL